MLVAIGILFSKITTTTTHASPLHFLRNVTPLCHSGAVQAAAPLPVNSTPLAAAVAFIRAFHVADERRWFAFGHGYYFWGAA